MKKTEITETSSTEMVTISRVEYENYKAQETRISEQDGRIAKLEQQVSVLTEALRLSRHKQFGASSEKSEDTLVEQLSFLFNEAEVFAEAKAESENVVVVPEHKRHKKHEYTLDEANLPENISTEVVEHTLEGESLECPQCGDTMTDIGVEVVKKLKIKSIELVVEEHRYHTYACQNCNKEDTETPIVKAPRQKSIIPGSFATPEAIAHIMVQKFVMGSPLYRQEQEINRMGVKLSRQTMSNWLLRASADYLTPVYNQLHKELLSREVLHGDETTLQVLHEKDDKSTQAKRYMWLYRTSGDTDKPIVLYEYCPGRGMEYPKAFLEGFQGYLHTDGYAGYHSLPGITVVGCWAHARRKFDEAVKSQPKGKGKGGSASQGLAYCNLLFEIEQGLAEKTAEERYTQRLEQAKPVLDAMLSWANSRTAAPQSALGKAFHYLKEQWPYLTNYLEDGRLEISNNRAERSIKPFVIDRKNFLFANTPKGATGSAVIFSMIQTAIENNLDPYRYLTWLLKEANNADLTESETVQRLLPWNAPKECKAGK